MKKILFASTALVASAGIAAAGDINFSGEAGFGFKYNGSDWAAHYDTTLSVAMTGETDGGLSFGADFDITAGDDVVGDTVVYIQGGFGKLSVGDVDNAVQAVTGLKDIGYDGLGTDNVAEVIRGQASANMLYTNTFADSFEVALSYNMVKNQEEWAIGGKYSMGDYSFALAYADYASGAASVSAQAGAAFGDISVAALYSTMVDGFMYVDANGNGSADAGEARWENEYGLTAAYTMGAVTVTAAYSVTDYINASNGEAYGIGVSYDLGGGATLDAGVAEVNNVTVADLGINMTF